MIGTGICRVVRFFYDLRNQKISHCNIVVPLGHGLLSKNKLPYTEKKILQEAVRIASEHQAQIIWASANYFWPGCKEQEDRLKLEAIKDYGFISSPIFAEGILNTVEEAKAIRKAITRSGIDFQKRTLVIVTDWPHVRRARIVFRKIFPESNIVMQSVEGHWNEFHPNFFARSDLRWLFINIVQHTLLIFGIKISSKLKQPFTKKMGE